MSETVPLAGLLETQLTVSDLDRSVGFYRDVVALRLAFEVPERAAAFLWISPPGHAMLGLWRLRMFTRRLTHVAGVCLVHGRAGTEACVGA